MNHVRSVPEDEHKVLHNQDSLRKALKDMGGKLLKISTAHHTLNMTLANFEKSQGKMDDPEMMSSLVDASLKKFFMDAGYDSTVHILNRIKTNH